MGLAPAFFAIALLPALHGAGPTPQARTNGHNDKKMTKTEFATFGGGCFWGVEEAFRTAPGVVATRVGYSGGAKEKPTYREVCSGDTHHAEVVRIEFDPAKTNYKALLDIFWKVHDPTQFNRQGPDVGEQYRSVIFYHSEQQHVAARESLQRETASGKHRNPIVTRILPASAFWDAEDYHQQYLHKRGLGSCHL